ncbi:ABC transporter G family member 14 [Planoprotostelium fungivorum]|uniref:ABC transporter G family member 14 n=1 Tax=Planoprotostelium fungivorum TaxID=1890364 RepID=A0A2P6N445_9EUKA|nr:ABC transporter G family member 14 [Planoprotostelium fungivorum]
MIDSLSCNSPSQPIRVNSHQHNLPTLNPSGLRTKRLLATAKLGISFLHDFTVSSTLSTVNSCDKSTLIRGSDDGARNARIPKLTSIDMNDIRRRAGRKPDQPEVIEPGTADTSALAETGGEMKYEIKSIALPPDEDDNEARRMMSRMEGPDLPMVLEFKNIEYTVTLNIPKPLKEGKKEGVLSKVRKNTIGGPTVELNKKILHGVTGRIAPGQFLAIMGPTGCGKTTLLGILAGRTKKGVTGDILVNGKPPGRDYKRRVAYVLQDDVMFAHLTVEQTLMYTARLRLPGNFSLEEKKRRVDQLIDVLNLNRARNTIIGGPFMRGVSGGERKRVNIGLELLTNPSIVLLDEPTSGLDTSTAINLVKVLKGMTDIGLTVISTIHQPSAQMFSLFDKLLLMVDGSPIYYGAAARSVPYFGSLGLEIGNFFNPADFIMNMILQEEIRKKGDVKKQLITAFAERFNQKQLQGLQDPEDIKEEEMTASVLQQVQKDEANHVVRPKYPISWPHQFAVLFQRAFIQAQGTYVSLLNVAQMVVIAILVGCFWFHLPATASRVTDRSGALFFVGLFAGGFYPLFQALFNFPPERAVLLRERAEGSYYLSAYYMAKVVSELPFIFFYPILFVCISYFMIQLRLSVGHFFIFLGLTCAICLVSSALGLVISCLIPDMKKANVFASIAMLTTTLIAGFYIRVENIRWFVQWMKFLSFIKYGFDAYIINEFQGRVFPADGPSNLGVPSVDVQGQQVIDSFGVIIGYIWINVLVVLGFCLVFHVVAFFGLKIIYKPRG